MIKASSNPSITVNLVTVRIVKACGQFDRYEKENPTK